MGWVLQVRISIAHTLFFLQPHSTKCSDEHFPFRLVLAITFVNGMASEGAVVVTLARHSVAQGAI